ncbi:MAG: hypothetical protein OHK0045_23290 [Raineya sp.]
MSWLCLNCETVNFDAENRCIVCGEERYYSASEVKQLLENHPETKSLREQVKKISTQNKWLQTRNKNLTQENKNLQNDVAKLLNNRKEEQTHQESLSEKDIQEDTEKKISKLNTIWKKKLRIWQISTLIATCIALFLWIKK